MADKIISDIATQVTEVPIGATAVLRCNSNDNQHNFLFWQLGDNTIIGPGNDYDPSKFKYNVLSGKLQIKSVDPTESGFYRCVSRHIDKGNYNIGAVEMVVKGGREKMQRLEVMEDPGDSMEIVKIVCIVISLIIMLVCAVIFYRMKKAEKTRNARLVMLAEDEDDEGSGDEIYNRTTKVINDSMPGPSHSPAGQITGIDNQGLDTDFNAAFEQISINIANRNANLI